MSTLLFSQGDLRDYLQSRNLALHEAVQREPEEHVLQVDVQEWATALGVVYSVEAPVLRAVEKEADPPTPSMVDVSHEQMRAILDRSQPALVAGTRTTVHVPFDGDAAVFRLRPSQFTYNPPQGDVATHEICLDLSWPNDRPLDVGSAVAGWLRVVEQYLVWARGDCEGHNRGLVSYAEAQIENRRRAVEQTRSVLTSAGIPIRGTSKRRITDAVVRRPRPVAGEVRFDPQLSDGEYDYILQVIRLQAGQMERSPSAYAGMNEESLRQVLVGALNTHYVGKVTAEAFNMSGKTDILIRDGERAVFIAECKRWTGAAAFSAAIDQLLSYTSWQDGKLALILFVENRDLTSVRERARAAVEAHPCFLGWDPGSGDDDRCRVSWPGDPRRVLRLAVILVHLPA